VIAPPLPLVFLPGAAGRIDLLAAVAARLSARRATLLCEYPGIGHAAPLPQLETLNDLREHVLQRLPERFDLLAKSMGGVLALGFALDHPERVRKLILVATSGGVDVTALGGLDWRETFQSLHPEAPAWFVDDRSDVTARLGDIHQPTLLVFGEDDLIAPVSVGRFLRHHLPHASLEILERATHDLEGEYPDLLASLVEAHLRKP
jgi:pimeloyl-ACP methyl ester carboxylesterase